MVFSILFFNNQTPHPGFYTLVPVLGVALIIGFSSPDDLVGKILGSEPFVWVGLISYSAYLWHFPIFAFSRMGTAPDNGDKVGWIVLTFFLSIISFFVIERPFRRREVVSLKVFLMIIFLATTAIGSVMVYFTNKGLDGLWGRYPEVARELVGGLGGGEWSKLLHPSGKMGVHHREDSNYRTPGCWDRWPGDACRYGDEKLVFLGDSYLAVYQRAFLDVLGEMGFVSLVYSACAFLEDQFWFGNTTECPYINKERVRVIEKFTDSKIFIFSANDQSFNIGRRSEVRGEAGDGSDPTVDAAVIWKSYFERINWLVSQGHKVVLIRTVPQPLPEHDGPAWLGANRHYLEKMNFPNLFNKTKPSALKATDDGRYPTFDPASVLVVDPADALCDLEKDRCWDVKQNYGPLYNAYRHVSYLGARLMAELVKERLVEVGWIAE